MKMQVVQQAHKITTSVLCAMNKQFVQQVNKISSKRLWCKGAFKLSSRQLRNSSTPEVQINMRVADHGNMTVQMPGGSHASGDDLWWEFQAK
jgi:hypothetical protein